MADRTCGGCAHWKAPGGDGTEWDANLTGLGVCGACKPVFDLEDELSAEIREGKYEFEGPAEAAYRGAMLAIGEREKFACNDGSGYTASLLTHRSFFCARHAPTHTD